MALESGYVSRNRSHRDALLRAILHQNADLLLHPLNGYINRLPPNRRLQLTPLRGPEIVRILKTSFGSTGFPVYRGGAADAQSVGRSPRRIRR